MQSVNHPLYQKYYRENEENMSHDRDILLSPDHTPFGCSADCGILRTWKQVLTLDKELIYTAAIFT